MTFVINKYVLHTCHVARQLLMFRWMKIAMHAESSRCAVIDTLALNKLLDMAEDSAKLLMNLAGKNAAADHRSNQRKCCRCGPAMHEQLIIHAHTSTSTIFPLTAAMAFLPAKCSVRQDVHLCLLAAEHNFQQAGYKVSTRWTLSCAPALHSISSLVCSNLGPPSGLLCRPVVCECLMFYSCSSDLLLY